MRIHSDILTPSIVQTALSACQNEGLIHEGVVTAVLTAHGSRRRAGAVELQLGAWEHTGPMSAHPTREYLVDLLGDRAEAQPYIRASSNRRRRNGGTYGAADGDYPMAATWHEWGYLLGALFAIDPAMTCDYYADADDFLAKTEDRPLSFGRWEYRKNGRVMDFLTPTAHLSTMSAA